MLQFFLQYLKDKKKFLLVEDIYRGIIHTIVDQDVLKLFARNQLKFGFTSIVQDYFLNTLVIFLDIMKISLGAKYIDEIDMNNLRELLERIYKTEDFIETSENKFIRLTNKGKTFLKENFEILQADVTTLEYDFHVIPPILEVHPLLGFWISIKDSGLFLYRCEAFEGLLAK